MKWIAQVGHVTVKDVRHSRWALAAYVFLLVVATAGFATQVIGPSSVRGSTDRLLIFLPTAAVMLGLIVVASSVQLDSPTSARAFWASRPIAPSAVLGAKLLVVATAVVAPSLIGAIVALRSIAASGATVAPLLADAAFSYGAWALAVIVVASLTDDIRTFVVAFLSILVGAVIADSLADSLGAKISSGTAFAIVGVVAGLCLVGYLYRTRDRRVLIRAAGVIVTACLLAPFDPASGGSKALRTVGERPIEISLPTASQGSAIRMLLRPAGAPLPEGVRFDLTVDHAALHLVDGRTVHAGRLHTSTGGIINAPPVGRSVRWLAGEHRRDGSAFADIEPRALDWEVVDSAVRSVAVDATVTASEARVLGRIPLEIGAALTHHGRRIQIHGVSRDASGVELLLQVSGVHRTRTTRGFSDSDVQLAIVNEARGEAFLIHAWNPRTGSGPIVLPWIGFSSSFGAFKRERIGPALTGLPVDDAWYSAARLVVVDWKPIGEYRTSATMELPVPLPMVRQGSRRPIGAPTP